MSTTVVYQSFRTDNVPEWINTCLNSVRSWARRKGYDYRFYDDEIFEYVPEWYRQKVNNQIHLVTDLARLNIAQALLQEGYEHTIWVDADVLVFEPDKLEIPLEKPFAFCQEIYIGMNSKRQLTSRPGVNNAIMMMSQGNELLPFYIDCCKKLVKRASHLPHTLVGTDFLTQLQQQQPIAHLHNVALFSPYIMHDLASPKPGNPALNMFCRDFQNPIYAANLCLTFNTSVLGRKMLPEEAYQKAIDALLADRGQGINQRILAHTNPLSSPA